jgi:hypothetical protein
VLAGRASCLNSLHRLGFVVRRSKKRLLKADAEKRAAFVREYAILRVVAQLTGAKTFFADEAHFSADADLRGTWVLKGAPALVDSTSTRWGVKASYSSAVSPARSVAVMSLVASSLTPVRTSTAGGSRGWGECHKKSTSRGLKRSSTTSAPLLATTPTRRDSFSSPIKPALAAQ